ncbi:MAG: hypothetical protein ACKO96_21630, partial [Flammeovirgaceae bacterium]
LRVGSCRKALQGILLKTVWLALVDCPVFDSPHVCKKKRRYETKIDQLEECDTDSFRRRTKGSNM